MYLIGVVTWLGSKNIYTNHKRCLNQKRFDNMHSTFVDYLQVNTQC